VVTFTENNKADISYPCSWKYKVVVNASQKIDTLLAEILKQKEYSCAFSHKSKNGKYSSYGIEILVFNEEERILFFDKLKELVGVKFVL